MQNFALHEAEFEALRAELQKDGELQMLDYNSSRYASQTAVTSTTRLSDDSVALQKLRRDQYLRKMRAIGIVQVTKGDRDIEFRVDQSSMFNGASYKGYVYALQPPKGHQKTSLDNYRIRPSDQDENGNYSIYKPMKGNWYLYLFVFS